nr:immunoglobulin heavy chain junction region [Mus musculus]MBK4183823.1 immunoglobulin heavy chain junction region [Mus musculus]MBK4183824.1 immunoglobulin heavy chain junction region [Mus musculus]
CARGGYDYFLFDFW